MLVPLYITTAVRTLHIRRWELWGSCMNQTARFVSSFASHGS